MIKQIIVPLVLVLGLGSGTAFATEAPAANPAQPAEMANPFAWMGMMNAGVPNAQPMNLARPEGYQAFMNPMNYGQFMNPATKQHDGLDES